MKRTGLLLLFAIFYGAFSFGAWAESTSAGDLPPYEGPPQEYLTRQPDQVVQKSFSRKYFRRHVTNNKDFLESLALPPFIQGGKIIGLKVLRDPQNPFWEKTGLKKDDVLIAIDQKPINELFDRMQAGKPPFEIVLLRGEQLIRLRIKVK